MCKSQFKATWLATPSSTAPSAAACPCVRSTTRSARGLKVEKDLDEDEDDDDDHDDDADHANNAAIFTGLESLFLKIKTFLIKSSHFIQQNQDPILYKRNFRLNWNLSIFMKQTVSGHLTIFVQSENSNFSIA